MQRIAYHTDPDIAEPSALPFSFKGADTPKENETRHARRQKHGSVSVVQLTISVFVRSSTTVTWPKENVTCSVLVTCMMAVVYPQIKSCTSRRRLALVRSQISRCRKNHGNLEISVGRLAMLSFSGN